MKKLIIIVSVFFMGCYELCDHVKEIYNSEIGANITKKRMPNFSQRAVVLDIDNQLSDVSFMDLYTDSSEFGKFVEEGDSIYKKKGTMKVMVYKNNGVTKLIKLNYDCSRSKDRVR